jgi:hypothetical protein
VDRRDDKKSTNAGSLEQNQNTEWSNNNARGRGDKKPTNAGSQNTEWSNNARGRHDKKPTMVVSTQDDSTPMDEADTDADAQDSDSDTDTNMRDSDPDFDTDGSSADVVNRGTLAVPAEMVKKLTRTQIQGRLPDGVDAVSQDLKTVIYCICVNFICVCVYVYVKMILFAFTLMCT